MSTGLDGNKIGGKPPSLSDAEAVALWDKLTGSIRARPTAPAKHANAPPPLGTTAFAGETCPQEGWWDCGEEGNGIETVNGRRQFFQLRDHLAQATLFRRPTLLQRMGGTTPSFQLSTPTMWTLVAYNHSTVDKITAGNANAPSVPNAAPPAPSN